MALIVLGAGATRGASFVNESKDPSCPPLDGDFFTQLQRIRNTKHKKLIDAVMKDTVEMFGSNFTATMETVFTTLEHTIRMLKTTGESRDFKIDELTKKRDRLKQSLAASLEESLTVRGENGESTHELRTCDYHDKLVTDLLRKGDDIISFNYDCTIDESLRHCGDGKWNARYGYGFNLGSRGKRFQGENHWNPTSNAERDETIKLLKLHGSLHFRITGTPYHVTLKKRPYTRQNGNLQFTIIPPEWHKAYDEGAFSELWSKAAEAIHRANSIVFIGYSMPATDLHSTALFRTSVKKKKLKHITVVNPDREARRRIRAVVQRGMTSSTRVLSFDCLSHFVASDRSVWS